MYIQPALQLPIRPNWESLDHVKDSSSMKPSCETLDEALLHIDEAKSQINAASALETSWERELALADPDLTGPLEKLRDFAALIRLNCYENYHIADERYEAACQAVFRGGLNPQDPTVQTLDIAGAAVVAAFHSRVQTLDQLGKELDQGWQEAAVTSQRLTLSQMHLTTAVESTERAEQEELTALEEYKRTNLEPRMKEWEEAKNRYLEKYGEMIENAGKAPQWNPLTASLGIFGLAFTTGKFFFDSKAYHAQQQADKESLQSLSETTEACHRDVKDRVLKVEAYKSLLGTLHDTNAGLGRLLASLKEHQERTRHASQQFAGLRAYWRGLWTQVGCLEGVSQQLGGHGFIPSRAEVAKTVLRVVNQATALQKAAGVTPILQDTLHLLDTANEWEQQEAGAVRQMITSLTKLVADVDHAVQGDQEIPLPLALEDQMEISIGIQSHTWGLMPTFLLSPAVFSPFAYAKLSLR
ncbi:hypothetical protein BO78DRAFT_382675 [Aspergillus sclerotiicarbonarius CBS 121057]|uniref:Uncharacterized protein n=1 Tax=Aspergillus sclerotiicarbonarius (strain CBS 121057 / IBT 28362) TaxID=1448318 RepID=A0A319ETK5_ASPSB|nr:hypothetical protein BO78DRAFT_382675 [Aspergillus sclerotiicarbonarius CBS 121057]